MTKLPDVCVLRTNAGLYITRLGTLNPLRRNAAYVTTRDAHRILGLVTSGFNDPLYSLSIEECAKIERRNHPPLSEEKVDALITAVQTARARARIAELIRQAEQHENLARHNRREAALMESRLEPPVGCNRSLGLNTDHRCVKGTDGCTRAHDGLTFDRDLGVHVCTNYQRPEGVLGGPCLDCGYPQPDHVQLGSQISSVDEKSTGRRGSIRRPNVSSRGELTNPPK